MIRMLVFFAALFAAALGFAWMADLPGVISVTWQGYVWEQSPLVVAILLAVAVLVILFVIWLIATILKSPRIASRFFRRRRRDKGYAALSRGLVALGVGDVASAKRLGHEADKLLRGDPASKLLLAQTSQLAGDRADARRRFEAMLHDPATKTLGLHGLYVEAEREGEPVAACHYAEEALKETPGLEWAGKAVLGYQAIAHDWAAALNTLDKNYSNKLIDKKTYRRHRAVLLTARALELEDGNPEQAYTLATEAHGLAQDLVPAAVVAARLAIRRNDSRRAARILETAWRMEPHPDLADSYAHSRIGDAATDRLERMKSLAAIRPSSLIGAMAVARCAIEARDFAEARTQMKRVLREEPTRSAFLLMAQIEELEHGDTGRSREWLARAVRAPLDKAWVADGVVRAEWEPVSPVTGKLDAFQWQTPAMLPESGDAVLAESAFDALPLPRKNIVSEPVKAAAVKPVEPAKAEDKPVVATPPAVEAGSAKEPITAPAAKPVSSAATSGVNGAGGAAKQAGAVGTSDAKKVGKEPGGAIEGAHSKASEQAKAPELTLSRMPDDPGVVDDESEDEDEKKRLGSVYYN